MVTWFYFITFAASVIMIGSFLFKNSRIDTGYVLFGLTIVVSSMGRWITAASETLPQAILGTKILYTGACYVPLVMIVLMARFSKIHIPRVVVTILAVFSTLVLGSVMTVGHTDWYYKATTLVHADGYNYIDKVYGPLHSLFLVLMIVDALMLAAVIIIAFRKRKTVAFQTVLIMGGLGFGVIIIYLLTKIFHSTFEWTSVGYLIAIIVITWLFERINMYDMTTNIANSVAQVN